MTKESVKWEDLYLDRPNGVAFDCVECGEPVYINPNEKRPRCIPCRRLYDIELCIKPTEERVVYYPDKNE